MGGFLADLVVGNALSLTLAADSDGNCLALPRLSAVRRWFGVGAVWS